MSTPRKYHGGPYNGQPHHTTTTGRTFSFSAKGKSGFYDADGAWHNEAKVHHLPTKETK